MSGGPGVGSSNLPAPTNLPIFFKTCGADAQRRVNAKSQWRRLRKKAGVENFRFHDIRHDVGTKLLRDTGNLKLVQRALHHADIKTTTRYAHVLDEEVAEALDHVQRSPSARRRAG